MKQTFDIQEELKKLPKSPGVYLMHDDHDNVIYVGKAKVLRNRVRQYFQASVERTMKIQKMVSLIAYFEYIVTDTEEEAFLLECNLIKEYRPKYNTMLVDDKTYPYIGISQSEDYPRIFISRSAKKDKNHYFGPFTSSLSVKDTLLYLQKTYHIRTCKKDIKEGVTKGRHCLYYDMGYCKAPCEGRVSTNEYREEIQKVLRFLNGDASFVIKPLEEKANILASENRFEEAIPIRDLIFSLKHVAMKQKITDSGSFDNRDVIALAKEETDGVVSIFYIREGKVTGRDRYHLTFPVDTEEAEILAAFLTQFYRNAHEIPAEIHLPISIEDSELTEDYLRKLSGHKVSIVVPKIGDKHKMLLLAENNAKMLLKKDGLRMEKEEEEAKETLSVLQKLLKVDTVRRIEAYDISNISGFESVGSMVVFENGKPKKQDYRKFRIKTVTGPDDYASMEEVLTRRFKRAKDMDSKFSVLPDLILMDGGKGQVHIALSVLRKMELNIPIAGMVKDDHHNTRGLYFEDRELPIDRHSDVFHLITRIQDEAHRFAITYHRGLHTQGMIRSVLDEIPGVGEKRKKVLMRAFSDINGIRNATEEEIAALDSFTKDAAHKVYAFLHTKE